MKLIEREVERRAYSPRSGARSPEAALTGILRCGYCGWALGSHPIEKKGKWSRNYRCRQPDMVRSGLLDIPAHPPVNIRQRKALSLLREMFQSADDDKIEQYARQFAGTKRPRSTYLAGQLERLRAAAADYELDLKAQGMRETTRAALAIELAHAREQIAVLEAEVSQEALSGPLNWEDLRDAMIELRDAEVWNLPPLTIRRTLQRIIPALYVRDGQFVPKPEVNDPEGKGVS